MRNDDTPSTLAARLEDLESRLAHQEHWLDQLDAAVSTQERRLMQLERLNALIQQRLREQQQALREADATTPRTEDEVPPHY